MTTTRLSKKIRFWDGGRIYRLCHHMDKLQSRAFDISTPSKKPYNMRKAWHRSIKRVKGLVRKFFTRRVGRTRSKVNSTLKLRYNIPNSTLKFWDKTGSRWNLFQCRFLKTSILKNKRLNFQLHLNNDYNSFMLKKKGFERFYRAPTVPTGYCHERQIH